jgi:hypothetical protein
MPALRLAPLALAALLLAGCLPGDRRNLSRDLFPADSLSRQIAEATPTDTLALVWRAEAPGEVRYPLTMVWQGQRLVIADGQRGGLHTFTDEGAYVGGFEHEAFQYPFLAGASGDTVAVLSRGRGEVHFVALAPDGGGRITRSVEAPEGRNAIAALHRGALYVKTADADAGSAIRALDPATGAVRAEYPLAPPFWRHIGLLRPWGDSLVALSGYRPVVHVLDEASPAGAEPDTLALAGFDSPQMHRSRLFALGEIREPPLLVPSAAASGERLFVLNARAGWVHVDVFRRDGERLLLERSLLSPTPQIGRNFFAADLAVRQRGDGFDLVVLENQPRPALVRYRWDPGAAP